MKLSIPSESQEPPDQRNLREAHQTLLNEFHRVAFRMKVYSDLENLPVDLDEFLAYYKNAGTHQGKSYQGRTPMDTFLDGKRLFAEKNLSSPLAA